MYGFIGVIVSVAVLLVGSSHPVMANNPYQLGYVDYFQTSNTKKFQKPKHYDLQFKQQETVPEPLGVLLEDPTEDNARLYLQWLKNRELRMKKVQDLIEKVSHEEVLSE